MSCSQPFSDVTKKYLVRFYEILDEMIEGMNGAELTDSLSHNFIVPDDPSSPGSYRNVGEPFAVYDLCSSAAYRSKHRK